ncbi:restriction endonuclease [Paraburkholderia youngii]|uniref:restriction endonuclease n=1 Tax=Paraburkholderia youngii TaxID=2782701 RepID=UPI0020CD3BBE|nr:restriction endonuclease [Paraburkholderia youngii]
MECSLLRLLFAIAKVYTCVGRNQSCLRGLISAALTLRYPGEQTKTLQNWGGQIWSFSQVMKKGDWVVTPLKSQPIIYVGEITGDYEYHTGAPNPFFHTREVKWIGEALPRSHFGQDLLYSFGAFMTICRIRRNNAEARVKNMCANGWKAENISSQTSVKKSPLVVSDDDDVNGDTDLEELGQDQIAALIEASFKGHDLTRLVDAILQAQGYTTWVSPEGADGGADILAGNGAMGFGQQKICVEVKSESVPIDRPTVDKLLGAMTKFNATEGLFVAWGGFKKNVQKELASSFFRLRLWSRKELLEQLFANYEKLSDEVKADLPLKRIWTVAKPEE